MEQPDISLNDLAVMINEGFDAVDKRFTGVDERLDGMDQRFAKIEATMVTKDYLDEKLADLRGDLVVLTRKEDNKVRKLVDILKKRKVLSTKEADEILSMEPFPDLGLHLNSGH